MPLTDVVKNAMLDAATALISHVSLHSAYSSSGANELTGGSPAYARKAMTWAGASSANADGTAAPTFDVPAGGVAAFVGYWSAVSAGTFRGMAPLGGGNAIPWTAVAGTDLFTADAHGLSNAQMVVLWDVGAGAVLPTGVTEGTIYHVRDVSGDTFKLAATAGGSAIDITTDGAGVLQTIVPETFVGQGTYALTDTDLNLIF